VGSLVIALGFTADSIAQALAGGDIFANIDFDVAAVAQAAANGSFALSGAFQAPPAQRMAMVWPEARIATVLPESRLEAA